MGRPAKKYELKCAVCGKEYIGENPARKYCGYICKSIAQSERDSKNSCGLSLAERRRLERAGKPLNDTLEMLHRTGEDYATYQKRMTLLSIPKIDVAIK